MSEILGQQVIIEAIGGAGGMTGSKRVAVAAPDGYTAVIGTVGSHAQSQTMYRKPLYNVVTDFTPVGLLADVPLVLIVRKDLPANNLQEFIAYAKANRSKMQFGSAGAGSATHLGCVVLNMSVFGAMFSYLLQALTFIQLRRKFPNIDRPYRSPFGVLGASLTVIIALVTIAFQLGGE